MASGFLEQLSRFVAPLARRVDNLVSRGVVKNVDDGKKLQELQVLLLDTELRDEIERFQNYGFTSAPSAGAEAVVIFPGGRRAHGLAICVDDRQYRVISLADGEVCVYDKTGSMIVLKASGDIELIPHSGKVKVTGDVEASGDVKAGSISLKNHTHAAGSLQYVNAGGTPTSVTGSTGGPS